MCRCSTLVGTSTTTSGTADELASAFHGDAGGSNADATICWRLASAFYGDADRSTADATISQWVASTTTIGGTNTVTFEFNSNPASGSGTSP